MSDTNGWRPIETAPKDGRWILLCKAGAAFSFPGRFDFAWWDATGQQRDPTHWMPLQKPQAA